MGEKCRFNKCDMHLCHGERCRNCCKTNKNETEKSGETSVLAEKESLFAGLQETIKNCSDTELFRALHIIRREQARRRMNSPKSSMVGMKIKMKKPRRKK